MENLLLCAAGQKQNTHKDWCYDWMTKTEFINSWYLIKRLKASVLANKRKSSNAPDLNWRLPFFS